MELLYSHLLTAGKVSNHSFSAYLFLLDKFQYVLKQLMAQGGELHIQMQ